MPFFQAIFFRVIDFFKTNEQQEALTVRIGFQNKNLLKIGRVINVKLLQ